MTRAPASAAIFPVSSVDPSSTTTISEGVKLAAASTLDTSATVLPMALSSLSAGITTEIIFVLPRKSATGQKIHESGDQQSGKRARYTCRKSGFARGRHPHRATDAPQTGSPTPPARQSD